jgi:serine/threonine protein kinase
MSGRIPFEHEDVPTLIHSITNNIPTVGWDHECFAGISADAIDLCRSLLCVDQTRRISAASALQHSWFFQTTFQLQGDEEEALELRAANVRLLNHHWRKLRRWVVAINAV